MDESAKQLARIGVFYIEEAILETLFQAHGEYVRAADLSRGLGIKQWDQYDWMTGVILHKMEADGRVEARRVNDRASGWKLTENEYSRRDGT